MADELRSDIAEAKARMNVKLGAGREIKRLLGHLWEGETVMAMTAGNYGRGTGLVVLTDRRLMFVQDGIMSKQSEDFPLDKISSVQWSSGLALGTITIFASGNKAEIKNVNKADGKSIVDTVRARLASPPAAPPNGGPDVMEQIRKLADLRDAGILSEDEFATKKAELLSRL